MMMRDYSAPFGLLFVWLIGVSLTAWVTPTAAAAGSDTLPDDWTGLISLNWESGIPADSPLHQQVERVSMRYEKRWHLYLTLHAESRGPDRVRYACTTASVDYHQSSATVGKNGAVSTNEVWKLEAGERRLDARQCRLVMVVDARSKTYWIETGRFEIADAHKTGQIVISVSGGSSVSEPINKKKDVVEQVRFKGEYHENSPPTLIGDFDAHVDPPPGVDMTHETLGGTIDWYLRRGACPEVRDRCYEEADQELRRCQQHIPEVFGEHCEPELYGCIDIISSYSAPRLSYVQGCVDDYCSWEYGTAEYDEAVDALIQCDFEWELSIDECDRLCP